MNVKDGFFEPAGEDVSGETDDLLGPDEGMHRVVYQRA